MVGRTITYRQAVILAAIYRHWKENGQMPVSSMMWEPNDEGLVNDFLKQIYKLAGDKANHLKVYFQTTRGFLASPSTWQEAVKILRANGLINHGSLVLTTKGLFIADRIIKLLEAQEFQIEYSITLTEEELQNA